MNHVFTTSIINHISVVQMDRWSILKIITDSKHYQFYRYFVLFSVRWRCSTGSTRPPSPRCWRSTGKNPSLSRPSTATHGTFHTPTSHWVRYKLLPLWGWNTHWKNSIPNGRSQWAFGMILLPYLVKIAIYGTLHHVRCLATWPRNARHVLRRAHYMWSFPDYLLFIYLWDVAEIGSWTCVTEFSSWNSPDARSKMKILYPRVRNIIL